jgi:hypothetical protein
MAIEAKRIEVGGRVSGHYVEQGRDTYIDVSLNCNGKARVKVPDEFMSRLGDLFTKARVRLIIELPEES